MLCLVGNGPWAFSVGGASYWRVVGSSHNPSVMHHRSGATSLLKKQHLLSDYASRHYFLVDIHKFYKFIMICLIKFHY